MTQPGTRRIVGLVSLASAALMLGGAVLSWTGVLPVSRETRPLLSGLLLLVAFSEMVVGLRFLGSSE